jgi:hypothetical protein
MLASTHYGDFTSKKEAVKCAAITVRWDGKDGTSKKTTFDPAPIYRDGEPTLEDLVHDCEPATFGFNGEDVFDEAVRKAGKLEAYKFSTNFNPTITELSIWLLKSSCQASCGLGGSRLWSAGVSLQSSIR